MLKVTIKNISALTLFLAVAMISWGCRKDVLEIRPYPVTLTELSLLLNQVPDPNSTTTFHFNGLNEDKILSTPSGIRLFLTDVDHLFSTLSPNPSPVACSTCSDLKIEITEINKRGDALGRGLPTTTKNDEILESVGMVEIRVFCDNAELQLDTGRTLKVQMPSAVIKDDLFVFAATSNDKGFAGWENTGQEVFYADWPPPGGTGAVVLGYELVISKLGWSNCAQALDATDFTPFCAVLEAGYTGQNTQAYLVFNNAFVVVPLRFDGLTQSFCFPNIPAGYPVRVISVAKLDTAFWLGAVSTETGTNSLLTVQPIKQEAQEILGYLRGL